MTLRSLLCPTHPLARILGWALLLGLTTTHAFLTTGAETRIVADDGSTTRLLEVDLAGRVQVEVALDCQRTNHHLQACGGQRLANGNTVIASYGIGARRTKLLEVTPEKRVVWTYTDDAPAGIHHFQILETNGRPLEGPAWR